MFVDGWVRGSKPGSGPCVQRDCLLPCSLAHLFLSGLPLVHAENELSPCNPRHESAGPHLLPGSNTFCMCGTNTGGFMLECNGISSSYTPTDSDKARNQLCNGWIHPKCMGLSKEHVRPTTMLPPLLCDPPPSPPCHRPPLFRLQIDKIEHVESFSCPWCASHERRMGKNRKQTGASAFRAPTLDVQEAFAKVSTQVPPDVLDEVASALTAITFAVAEENASLGVRWWWLRVRGGIRDAYLSCDLGPHYRLTFGFR